MSRNQETELLSARHAGEGLVDGVATSKVGGKVGKRKKVAVAEHMKYHKPTAKHRALKVPCTTNNDPLLLYHVQAIDTAMHCSAQMYFSRRRLQERYLGNLRGTYAGVESVRTTSVP